MKFSLQAGPGQMPSVGDQRELASRNLITLRRVFPHCWRRFSLAPGKIVPLCSPPLFKKSFRVKNLYLQTVMTI